LQLNDQNVSDITLRQRMTSEKHVTMLNISFE